MLYVIFPLLACTFFAVASSLGLAQPFVPTTLNIVLAVALVPILLGTVFAAVHHAEVIAKRTGEPFGTLVLTIAVTVIEVALIVSLLTQPQSSPALVRDTVFAVVMIVCNGLVGVCILSGGLRYGEPGFQVSGANAYLAVLMVMATLTLVLPNQTVTVAGPIYSTSQLVFVGLATLALYAIFLFIQMVRHRDHFTGHAAASAGPAAGQPTNRDIVISIGLLLIALSAVVLLAKKFAAVVEAGTLRLGAPPAIIGVIIALLVLLPESIAAVKAARRDDLQTSLNLALGSSLATIGLTVPAVAALNLSLRKELELGLDPANTALLTLTMATSVLTFGTGRTNILFGFIHLVIFATYAFLLFIP